MCMDGSKKSVEDYKDCHLGKEPARAVIGRMDADSQEIYKVLTHIPVCHCNRCCISKFHHTALLLKKDPVIVLIKGVILI